MSHVPYCNNFYPPKIRVGKRVYIWRHGKIVPAVVRALDMCYKWASLKPRSPITKYCVYYWLKTKNRRRFPSGSLAYWRACNSSKPWFPSGIGHAVEYNDEFFESKATAYRRLFRVYKPWFQE